MHLIFDVFRLKFGWHVQKRTVWIQLSKLCFQEESGAILFYDFKQYHKTLLFVEPMYTIDVLECIFLPVRLRRMHASTRWTEVGR